MPRRTGSADLPLHRESTLQVRRVGEVMLAGVQLTARDGFEASIRNNPIAALSLPPSAFSTR